MLELQIAESQRLLKAQFETYGKWKDGRPDALPLDDELHWIVKRIKGDPKHKEAIILPISDLHYGNSLFSPSHFYKTLQYIENHPYVYVVLNGDLCECITKNSAGVVYEQIGSPQDQRDWVIEQLKPIQKRILGMTMGNHEYRIWNEAGIDICRDIAEKLGIFYRPDGLLIRLDLNDFSYWLYMTHGYGGARTKSGKAVKLERTATWVHADIYLMSHDHIVNAEPDVYLMPDETTLTIGEDGVAKGFMVAHRKMLVKSNAYLKWGGYSESKGYGPVDLETPLIKLAGENKPRIRVEI